MSFLYSNNFLFKNDVAANVIITKKKKKKNWGRFSYFWARVTENPVNTGQSIIMTGLRYKLENWYVFLDIEDIYTLAK